MVIWHSVALSFNECLVSLITSKCDSWVLGLKRKVPRFTCHNPAVSKVAITPPHPSPPLDLRARLNYPTASPRPLTAALAGVSFPRRSHLSGWEISQCSSASAKATDIFDQRALSLRARRRKWGEQSQRGWNITPPPNPPQKALRLAPCAFLTKGETGSWVWFTHRTAAPMSPTKTSSPYRGHGNTQTSRWAGTLKEYQILMFSVTNQTSQLFTTFHHVFFIMSHGELTNLHFVYWFRLEMSVSNSNKKDFVPRELRGARSAAGFIHMHNKISHYVGAVQFLSLSRLIHESVTFEHALLQPGLFLSPPRVWFVPPTARRATSPVPGLL